MCQSRPLKVVIAPNIKSDLDHGGETRSCLSKHLHHQAYELESHSVEIKATADACLSQGYGLEVLQ